MDRTAVVNYLASLDDQEWSSVVADARGTDVDTDAALRAAEKSGDWQTSMALKSQQLSRLLNPNQEHP